MKKELPGTWAIAKGVCPDGHVVLYYNAPWEASSALVCPGPDGVGCGMRADALAVYPGHMVLDLG